MVIYYPHVCIIHTTFLALNISEKTPFKCQNIVHVSSQDLDINWLILFVIFVFRSLKFVRVVVEFMLFVTIFFTITVLHFNIQLNSV